LAVAVLALGCASADEGPATRPSRPADEKSVTVGTRPARLDEVAVVRPPVPVRLRVPAIAVDAPIVPVGVNEAGDLTVPTADDVGWYRFGSAPGRSGSAVLAAHVDFDGRRGAFFRLGELTPGAVAEVVLDNGRTRAFRAVAADTHSKGELPDELFARTGPTQLVLITCGGSFDADARRYADNVVVTATPA
jgi:sortase (surface protein transpeptidase)